MFASLFYRNEIVINYVVTVKNDKKTPEYTQK